MRVRPLVLLALAALAAGGCATDLPPLPPEPGRRGGPETPPPGPGPAGAGEVPPTRLQLEGFSPLGGEPAGDALAQARSGDRILPGVVLLDPALDADSGAAAFAVRNDTGQDLPDLILAVIYAVAPASGAGPAQPRFETVEAPLRAGETRRIAVTLSARRAGERLAAFRVAAGVPEILTAGGNGMPGTTFLGGLLECVSLEAELTAAHRQVTVGLTERGAATAGVSLPALEGQLLCSRAGELVYAGPWILVPRSNPDGGKVRRIQWNLDGAPGLAGCDLFLRVREKR